MNCEEIVTSDKNPKSLYDCIVFDLDGTLVHASKKQRENGIKLSFKDMHDDPMEIWIHKRPGFDTLLQKCSEFVTVGVWSMGQPGYVNAVVSLFPQKPAFVYSWCECDRDYNRANFKIFKRLNNIPHTGSNILMIDDTYQALETCARINTLIVSSWHPNMTDDTMLYDLSKTLFHDN